MKQRSIVDVFLTNPVSRGDKNQGSYISGISKASSKIRDEVNNHIKIAQERQKFQFDKDAKENNVYSVGDKVLVVNERKIPGQSKSFRYRLVGPFKFLSQFNDVNSKISCLNNGKEQVIHYNR